jgi:hypothetical protein
VCGFIEGMVGDCVGVIVFVCGKVDKRGERKREIVRFD